MGSASDEAIRRLSRTSSRVLISRRATAGPTAMNVALAHVAGHDGPEHMIGNGLHGLTTAALGSQDEIQMIQSRVLPKEYT